MDHVPNADVHALPTRRKEPPDGRLMLVPPPRTKCSHFNTQFEIDKDAGKCKCLGCNEEVSPIFVLLRLMEKESRWMQTREAHQEEMRRLKERSRTKCEHCGEMTRISHRR